MTLLTKSPDPPSNTCSRLLCFLRVLQGVAGFWVKMSDDEACSTNASAVQYPPAVHSVYKKLSG